MTLPEFREALSNTLDTEEPIGLTIHLVINDGENDSIYTADISDEIEEELRGIFINSVNNRFNEANTELYFAPISIGEERSNSAYYYDLDEFPEKLETFQGFHFSNEYPDFSFADDDLENVKAFIITIGNENNHFKLYKKVYPISLIRRDSFIGLIPSQTRFIKLASNILKINETFEFILINNSLIIYNLKSFTKDFGFKDIIHRKANENVELINQANLIEDIEDFQEFLGELKYAKKMMKLRRNSPVLRLEKQRIFRFVNGHNILSKKIKFNDDNTRMVLQTKVAKEHFLKLMNDDFLKSNLTEIDYDSESKTVLEVEE